jgi:hypothetical protein
LEDEDEAEVREALEEANEVLVQEEKTKLAYSQAADKKYEDEVAEATKKYRDDKTKKGAFWVKVKPYHYPCWAIFFGFIFCLGQGACMPIFGMLIPRALFAMGADSSTE